MDGFRFRLNSIDHYQATPSKYDPILRNDVTLSQLQKEPKIPIIRIFGATETGQKVCAHIHGAFPYLYVEYNGSLMPEDVGTYIRNLHLSIDQALAVSYRITSKDYRSKFVARITLVKGIPFYGFHVRYQFFLKIYMLNPMVMTRLSDILRQGAVMKRTFQPFEAHLQFLLQWMIDFNLYGCAYINCRKAIFRAPVPRFDELDKQPHLWHDCSIPQDMITDDTTLERTSYCSIEADICVQDILNRLEVKSRDLHHNFLERLRPLAPTEKLVPSLATLWREETRRRKAQMSDPDPGSSPFSPEMMMSLSFASRFSQHGGWIKEDLNRQKILDIIREEKSENNGNCVTFDNFVRPIPLEETVKTALESVEDLFIENLRVVFGLNCSKVIDPEKREATEVDEKQLSGWLQSGNESLCETDVNLQNARSSQPSMKNFAQNISNTSVSSMEDIPVNLSQAKSNTLNNRTSEYIDPKHSVKSPNSINNRSPANFDQLRDQETFIIDSTIGRKTPRVLKRDRSDSLSGKASKRRRISPTPESQQHMININSEHLVIPDSTRGLTIKDNTSKLHIKVDQTGKADSNRHFKDKDLALSPLVQKQQKLTAAKVKLREKPLRFPVVKDPYRSSTNLKLDQKMNSQDIPPIRSCPALSKPPLQSPRKPSFSQQAVALTGKTLRPPYIKPLSVIDSMRKEFDSCGLSVILIRTELAPSKSEAMLTMQNYKLDPCIYQDAFYSDEFDVPESIREWAGREFKLESLSVPFLPEFDPSGDSHERYRKRETTSSARLKDESFYKECRRLCGLRSWSIAVPPPTYHEVLEWSRLEQASRDEIKTQNSTSKCIISPGVKKKLSQIEGPTQKNKHGFKYSQHQQATNVKNEAQFLSIMSLEIHISTRGGLAPNPEEDEARCLFWCLVTDEPNSPDANASSNQRLGIVVLSEDGHIAQQISKLVPIEVLEETSELDLMIRMVSIVRAHDPDILTGYEVHCSSWGYLIQRARLKYDYDLCEEFSRVRRSSSRFGKENDKWGTNHTSNINITGRHVINIWRAMRSELNLLQYTMENVVFHLLHRRIPHYTWADLTKWFKENKARNLSVVINYYLSRVQLNLEILERNELIERTCEQARLLGVDFFSVISRGSQFKVESLMFRIAKPENFIIVSPSRKQVGSQNALECLPLVMEPQSAFYNCPLLVLDFQSLYPSVMIAYNYCYSTFLGRINNWRGTNKMGFSELKRQKRLLELLKDYIVVSPNGMMYVKPEIRKSLLSKMLGEILETRVMIKSSMKREKNDKALHRLLNNRQLALKLIANVTYGYTSASFSGRMPCAEIADSIVQTGRETLERAIALIHSVKKWNAEVVYGDTDSLFVYLRGRTKDQAFDIGEEIAQTVTNMSPRPIKLKFEKVYLPCILIAKKRYVGFKYENRHQVEPEFDAKGIETVRRDGTPAEQKIEEKALKILLRTSDLSQVKKYFQSQCEKIMKGSVSIQDFCFAREVRLGTYSDKGPLPPGALISSKKVLEGSRNEPQYGERVPYVVIAGAPGSRLIDRCVDPEILLQNSHHELDSEYYISKNLIPPLERIFNLTGANVRTWYDEMPKFQRVRRVDLRDCSSNELVLNKKTMESYMRSSSCLVCRDKVEVEGSVCTECMADLPRSLFTLRQRLRAAETKFVDLQKVCQSCSQLAPLDEVRCDSKDCPVFYTRRRHEAYLKSEKNLIEPLIKDLTERSIHAELEW
ncbi:DNA polymerase zeta catalytic subunit [Podosphaera aphanis]|nr:DNA polymerase zeta catalytic subunit [Podosphaera aphanis]